MRMLTGWKAIADFLNVSVSTAKRYAKKGMPLYGGGFGKNQQPVWADSDEIKEWRKR